MKSPAQAKNYFVNKLLLVAVVTLDYSAIGVVYTSILFLFVDSKHSFISIYNRHERFIILGLLFAITYAGQFLAAPVLGKFSDQWGRRKGLIITTSGTFCGIFLSGVAINAGSLALLFISRLITGLFAANLSIAQASFADISQNKSRTVHFNLLEIGIGAGSIIGPMLGSHLIDAKLVGWFSYSTPFYILSIVNLIIVILLMALFRETVSETQLQTYRFQRNMNQTRQENKLTWMIGINNIIQAFYMAEVRFLFLMWALFSIGFAFYIQFFNAFLRGSVNFSEVQIGHLYVVVGIMYAVLQITVVFPLVSSIRAERLIKPSLIVAAIFLLLLGLSRTEWQVYLFRLVYMLAIIIFMPCFNAVVANETTPANEGHVFGILASIYAFASIPISIIGSIVASYDIVMPLAISGIMMLVVWFFLALQYQPSYRNNTDRK
ncbi:MAG: MFS transporter [Pseudomonadota bacterium]